MTEILVVDDYPEIRHLLRTCFERSEHPAARFAVDGALHLELCKSLLDLAEHLPGRLDREGIAYFLKVLASTWEAHVAFQSEAAFPLLKRRYEGDRDVLKCLGRLERQHIEIAGSNDELIEQLVHVLNGETVDCEMLGYLIRNAAERRREHVEWEQSFLNSLFPRLLMPLERPVLFRRQDRRDEVIAWQPSSRLIAL